MKKASFHLNWTMYLDLFWQQNYRKGPVSPNPIPSPKGTRLSSLVCLCRAAPVFSLRDVLPEDGGTAMWRNHYIGFFEQIGISLNKLHFIIHLEWVGVFSLGGSVVSGGWRQVLNSAQGLKPDYGTLEALGLSLLRQLTQQAYGQSAAVDSHLILSLRTSVKLQVVQKQTCGITAIWKER